MAVANIYVIQKYNPKLSMHSHERRQSVALRCHPDRHHDDQQYDSPPARRQGEDEQTTNSKQQTANSKQQTTNNKQQTTNNKQQTTNNKQQTTFSTRHDGSACQDHGFLICKNYVLGNEHCNCNRPSFREPV
jgi:hypothetical protein